MKKITLLMLLLALVFAGCNNKRTEVAVSDNSDTLNIPSKKYLTEQQLQEQINQEIEGKLMLANDEKIEEAIQIINLTESAIKDILDSSYTKASEKLEDAIGKASVLTATRPDLSFFPLNVQITTRDLVADMNDIKAIRKEADLLTDKGYLQAARHLLTNIASELEIRTPMLPIATYPNALANAAKALAENKPDEALILLNTALSTVFIETQYIPLPIIRAERMLTEVADLLNEKGKENDLNTLLENAEYQIRFAEALGYGKKDKEFEEIYSAIKELKQEVKKADNGNSAGLTKKLREKLKLFKDRISTPEKTDNNEPK